MNSIQERLESFYSKPLEVEIKKEKTSLWIIDWLSIVKAHEAVMEQTIDMSDEEAGEFLCDHETELIQITECFMNDKCDAKVEEEEWLPIGLLGLNLPPQYYAEPENKGLLLLDLRKGTVNPPVVYFKKDKAKVLYESFSDFLNIIR